MEVQIVDSTTNAVRDDERVSDFLSADIDTLMNTDITPQRAPTDHDKMYSDYDRELMSFRPVRKRRTWPQPIR